MCIQKEQKESQESVLLHLGKIFEDVNECWVSKYHFPLGALERNGNKAIAVAKDDDANVELPKLPGEEGK